MDRFQQDFSPRQYMVTPDFEFFHYKDESTMEIEYHNHEFYEIYFFISGRVTYLIEGKSYKLRPGDIILINNSVLHKPIIESAESYERMVVWVNPGFITKQSREDCDLSMCFESSSRNKYNLLRPNAETLNSIRGTISKFEKACKSTSFGSDILKNIYLTELIVFLNRAFQDTQDEGVEFEIEYNEKVNSVIRYINNNLHADLSLDALSLRFYMSKYHLLREFKRHAGYTIHQYIQKKRLIMAKALLREGIPLTEVCIKCGFEDYSNFIRSFKKAYGVSPKRYFKLSLV